MPDTTRYLSLVTVGDISTVLLASEPSDCLHLEREHIHSGNSSILKVIFDVSANDKNLEQWKEALSHLLQTYRPHCLEIRHAGQDIGILDGLHFSLRDGTDYIARDILGLHIFIYEGYAKCFLNHVVKCELHIIILSI